MLLHRLKVAIPLIVVAALALSLPGLAGECLFALLALAFLAGAVHEAFALAEGCPGTRPYRGIVLGAGVALMGAAWLSSRCCANWLAANLFMDLTIALLALMGSCGVLFRLPPRQEALNAFSRACFNGLFYCWMLAFLAKIYFLPGGHGALLLGFVICITKLGDIGAYFLGCGSAALMKGGNHKLSPLISPKKSWEGLVGGFIFSVAGAWLFWHFSGGRLGGEYLGRAFTLTQWDALGMGALAAPVGLLGDLVESVVKRAAGAKDSGHIPGLGGVLDIADSLVPTGMLCYVWMLCKLI